MSTMARLHLASGRNCAGFPTIATALALPAASAAVVSTASDEEGRGA